MLAAIEALGEERGTLDPLGQRLRTLRVRAVEAAARGACLGTDDDAPRDGRLPPFECRWVRPGDDQT